MTLTIELKLCLAGRKRTFDYDDEDDYSIVLKLQSIALYVQKARDNLIRVDISLFDR